MLPSNQLRILKYQWPPVVRKSFILMKFTVSVIHSAVQNAVQMSTCQGEPELRELNKTGVNSTAAGLDLGKPDDSY